MEIRHARQSIVEIYLLLPPNSRRKKLENSRFLGSGGGGGGASSSSSLSKLVGHNNSSAESVRSECRILQEPWNGIPCSGRVGTLAWHPYRVLSIRSKNKPRVMICHGGRTIGGRRSPSSSLSELLSKAEYYNPKQWMKLIRTMVANASKPML
eukprot:scaffold6494_cov109-Cylindrotheca_fusiformis.AAC.2